MTIFNEMVTAIVLMIASIYGLTDGDTLQIDRIEGNYTIIEVGTAESIEHFEMETTLLTQLVGESIEEGDIIEYNDGKLTKDTQLAEDRRQEVAALIERLRNR